MHLHACRVNFPLLLLIHYAYVFMSPDCIFYCFFCLCFKCLGILSDLIFGLHVFFRLLNYQAEAKILRGPHEDLESYLEAIDQLKSNVKFFSSNKSFKSSDGVLNHANNLLAKAISKLEDEFRNILTSYRFISVCTFVLS